MLTSVQKGEHLPLYPNVVHDRRRARKTPAADREEQKGADWKAHPVTVHRRFESQNEPAVSGAQSSLSRAPESRDSTKQESAARQAVSAQPPLAPRALPLAQSEGDSHPALPIRPVPPQCRAEIKRNPSFLP